MSNIRIILILIACILFSTTTLYAELSNDDKMSLVGRALSFAVGLDAAETYCGTSHAVSSDRYDTLKTLVSQKLGLDLDKMAPEVNKLFGVDWVNTISDATKMHIDDLGGCNSSDYYEWLIKNQKKHSENIFLIMTLD